MWSSKIPAKKYFFFCTLLFFCCKTNATQHFHSNFETAFSECDDLTVSQNGPVTLDIPITFKVQLSCDFDDNLFAYFFKDNVDPPHEIMLYGNRSVSTTILYPENIYKPGEYTMTVSAYLVILENMKLKIATRNVSFAVTEYIPGVLNISGVSTKYDKMYISTGKTVNMTINVHFPDEIYDQAEMSYSWSVDKDQFITVVPYNSYTFMQAGTFDVRVAVVARMKLYNNEPHDQWNIKYKWGYFNEEISVKDPFDAINLTGNVYLKHGQLFNLNVSCNGSGPFEYCWKVFQPPEVLKNLTCLSPVITTKCSFPIIYYFHQSGDYHVSIYINNFVSVMQRNIEVRVYDVSRKAQLSTVILPLFCSVLVVFIIAAGMVLHFRRNQRIDIETADFDFLQSDACVMETFWDRLFRSVVNALSLGHHLSTLPHLCLTNMRRSSSHSNYNSVQP